MVLFFLFTLTSFLFALFFVVLFFFFLLLFVFLFIVTVIVIKIKERFGNTKTSKKITRMKSNDLSLYRDAIFKFKKGLVDKLSEITKIFN